MYSVNQLEKYNYFKELLKQKDISYILDPLTGLVSRTYMIEFTRSLIEEGRPFTFGMIDLDNFKEVNDTYGHSLGDEVLAEVSKTLIDFLDDYGIAGRYGGDEFVFINTRDLDYDQKKKWCDQMYETETFLKKVYKLSTRELFVTGTAGMATYPSDAKSYDELFTLLDKCLYRGKSKGRNCYIIYVERLHKDIVIKSLKSNTLYDCFKNLDYNLSHSLDLKEKMRLGYEAIKNDIHVTNMYYLDENNEMISVVDNQPFLKIPDIDALVYDDVSMITSISKIAAKCWQTAEIFSKTEYDTLLIGKISDGENCYGYLVCTEPKIQRIWQDKDLAIMYYFGKMLGLSIKDRKDQEA